MTSENKPISAPKVMTATLAILAFAMAMMAVGVSAMGLDDPLVGGLTVSVALEILGFFAFMGMIIWALKVPKLKGLGSGMALISLPLIFILVIAIALTPVSISPIGPGAATFDVLSVTTENANYTDATHVITAVMRVNSTAGTITSPTSVSVNFTVQRTDVGTGTTDIKTVTASVSPSTLTDPITAISYSSVKPNTDGRPNCNWTLNGAATATRTLTAQMGMTPYQTGYILVNIEWNPSAFTTSNVAVNDVISAGSIVVAGEVYTLQVLIAAVDT